MLPKSKFDIEQAKNLSKVSLSSLEPYLDELFKWLQDRNWPVFPYIASVLASAGLSVVPSVRKILQGNDDIWKMWVLSSVVNTKDLAVASALRDEIKQIANNPTKSEVLEGNQKIAKEILRRLENESHS